jgi:hypothetical protein
MEVNPVLDIQVGTPVTNLCGTAERFDLKNRIVEAVMN